MEFNRDNIQEKDASGEDSVKQIKIINDDFLGRVEILRHACSGKVLLCYEPVNDM